MRLRYFAVLAIPALTVLYAAIMTVPWRLRRVFELHQPLADPQGAGYQVIQSLIAVGTGGVTGVGLMEGRQKLFYLPYPYSDFIFAVIGEELGLLGAVGGRARLRRAPLARAARGVERARRLRPLPRRRPHALDRAAGAHQRLA